MRNHPAGTQSFHIFAKGAAALMLALCLGAGARAQQEQQDQKPPDQQQAQPEQAQQQDQSQDKTPATTDSQAKPSYAPQDADKPPYARDRAPQNRQMADRSTQNQSGGNGAGPDGTMPNGPTQGRARYGRPMQNQPAPEGQSQQVPPTLTIPAGTILNVRVNDFLSSDKNKVGDHFTAELERPIVVNGWVVAQRGQTLEGQVKDAKKAGRVKGTSELDLELTDLSIVDGKQLPVLTQLWKASGGTSHGADAATIAGGTGLGAAIGAAADWGRGAAIGAGAGAVAGIATVLLTRGRPTELYPESELTFRLQDPVTVDTTQSQQAFYPVSPRDYEARDSRYRGRRLAAGYPGYPYPAYPYYPYYPCGYYGACYGYPGFVGIYGGYGWGPRYYGGFHGWGGRGWGGFRR